MTPVRVTLVAVALATVAPAASGQFDGGSPVDPEAARAFEQLVTAYRARPALEITTTLRKEIVQGDVSAPGEEIEAGLTYSAGDGIVRLRGFTCYIGGRTFSAVHDSTDDSYYSEPFEDSPYWAFLINFQDIPFPHLAILWGEPRMEDLYMQLYPDTPMIVPTALGEVEADGAVRRRIVLSGPDAEMRLDVDPATDLISAIEHEITGGRLVEPGARIINRYRFDYQTFDRPLGADVLAFDRGERQRVDLLPALVERRPPPGGGFGGPMGPAAGVAAPGFVLATMAGGAIDLEALRGRIVVLDFWATWCGPCRRGLPLLHEVGRWAREQELPVEIVTINVWEKGNGPDDKLAAAKAFWETNGFTLPVAMDYADETAAAYGVGAIPATFIVRADGLLAARHDGLLPDYAETLKREITEAIEALK